MTRLAPAEAGYKLDDVERAISDIADGRPMVVLDDADREDEGDIIFAAAKATPELMAFTIRYTSGVICVPMPGADLDRLALPLMTAQNSERMRTAFTVSVDAADGITTGISAADRTTTVRALLDPESGPGDLLRPGHIFPLRYAEGGVLRRPGHTEAAVDLARMAGLRPAGVLCEIVSQKDEGDMARLSNASGSLELAVTVSDIVPQGVAYSPKGRWLKREQQQANVNVLNDGRKADFGASTSVHGVEVTVEPV